MDRISKKSEEKVIIQIGRTEYEPQYCDYFTFTSYGKFLNYIKNAKVVVTHAGVGTIIECLMSKKSMILVPRRKKFDEHIDDHQIDIAKALEKENIVIVCYDVKNLKNKITHAKKIKPKLTGYERQKLEKTLIKFVENLRK